VAALIARHIQSTNQAVVVLASAVPYVTIVSAIGVLVLLAVRQWWGVAVALLVCGTLAAPQIPVLVASPGKAPVGATLRVATFNMRLGRADPAEVVKLVRDKHVDILAIEELTPEAFQRLQTHGLAASLPFSFAAAALGGDGVAIFSRLRLSAEHEYPGFHHRQISARVTLPSGAAVTVYATHMESPRPGNANDWARELNQLTTMLTAARGCLIDAGDFNATVDHVRFRTLLSTADLTDASTQAGSIGLRSYPSNVDGVPPLIAIDHVVTRDLRAAATESFEIAHSDHRVVLATLDTSRCTS
jgi:endonuclease/exonuclease/phosphatase (EEP) superfamily protein YafD